MIFTSVFPEEPSIILPEPKKLNITDGFSRQAVFIPMLKPQGFQRVSL